MKTAQYESPNDDSSPTRRSGRYADRFGGQTYTDFLTGVLRRTSGKLSTSQDGLDLHNQLLTQAQALRDQRQGVSLEEEAVNLLQYQRAFEAAARVIHVIDDLTQTAISLVPQA